MRKELAEQIYQIDPVFFRQKDWDMTQTCMCWGIECGDGWFEPIKQMVQKVSVLNRMLAPLNMCIVASQIKSKFAEFRCYWDMEALNPNVDKTLTDEQNALISTVHDMMDDVESGCSRLCNYTCELCGKYSTWEDDVFVCGSWLTVKCVDCAQKKQREDGRITNFREGFQFLSPFNKETIHVDGIVYHSPIAAHYGTLHPQYQGVFVDIKEPSVAQSVAMNMNLCRDDYDAVVSMQKVLIERYKDDDMAKKLVGTKGLEIVSLNHRHENFWGSCCCKECEGKGQNNYGKLLMEIRDKLVKGEIPQNDKD